MAISSFQNTPLMRLRVFIVVFSFVLLIAGQLSAQPKMRILAMGDSMMAMHKSSGKSVSEVLRRALDAQVADRSVSGARMIYNLPLTGELGFKIAKQYRPGNWDWVVLNGGGNDLLFGCGCMKCDDKLNKLISADGTSGVVVDLVQELRATGAQVAYVGYMHSPGVGSAIDHCRDEGLELERRAAVMALDNPGVYFVSLYGMVPDGDKSYHSLDMIHPSTKGSWAIARRIARRILLPADEE